MKLTTTLTLIAIPLASYVALLFAFIFFPFPFSLCSQLTTQINRARAHPPLAEHIVISLRSPISPPSTSLIDMVSRNTQSIQAPAAISKTPSKRLSYKADVIEAQSESATYSPRRSGRGVTAVSHSKAPGPSLEVTRRGRRAWSGKR
jgi:hypothetical protein